MDEKVTQKNCIFGKYEGWKNRWEKYLSLMCIFFLKKKVPKRKNYSIKCKRFYNEGGKIILIQRNECAFKCRRSVAFSVNDLQFPLRHCSLWRKLQKLFKTIFLLTFKPPGISIPLFTTSVNILPNTESLYLQQSPFITCSQLLGISQSVQLALQTAHLSNPQPLTYPSILTHMHSDQKHK